jgi:hypothetical protein
MVDKNRFLHEAVTFVFSCVEVGRMFLWNIITCMQNYVTSHAIR